MIRGYLDRMMRPCDLELQFRRVVNPEHPGLWFGAIGILSTSQALQPGDLDRIRAVDARGLVDGQINRIPR